MNDDYGDVFGVYFALTGNGFSPKELEDFAIRLRANSCSSRASRTSGSPALQQQAIYVELLPGADVVPGISLQEIFDTLKAQNLVAFKVARSGPGRTTSGSNRRGRSRLPKRFRP